MSAPANGRATSSCCTRSPSGPADRSYGIAVAKLAGLPPPVLARAKSVLAKLEQGRAATGGIAAGLDDLPLFAAVAPEEEAAPDPVHEALAADRARQPGAARGAGAGLRAEAAPGRERTNERAPAIPHQREIVDRRALAEALEGAGREAAAAILKEALARRPRRDRAAARGQALCRAPRPPPPTPS